MKCKSLRIFCLSLLVFLFLSSPLFSEWCFEDEDYQAMLDNQAEQTQELASQETRINELVMHLETAENWRVTSNKAIQYLKDSHVEAMNSWRKRNTVTAITAGSIGLAAGIIIMVFIGGMK